MQAIALTLLFASVRASASFAQSAAPCPRCNVVLVTIDTLRPDYLGCYGHPRPTSPGIDLIASQGLIFDDANAPAYLTPVGMASILTSLYPAESGYEDFSATYRPGIRTLPEALRHHGYTTGASLTSPEFFFKSESEPPGPQNQRQRTFQRGFDWYDTYPAHADFRAVPGAALFEWLRDRGRQPAKPFFLWVGLGSAHWPYALHASSAALASFVPPNYNGPLPRRPLFWWEGMGMIYKGWFHWADAGQRPLRKFPFGEDERAQILGRYEAGVHYTDAFVARLWDSLKREGLSGRTLLIITAQHAEDLGEHGYYTHYDIYQTELRVPLIVVPPWPSAAIGRRVANTISTLDIAPTVLEALGVPILPQTSGRSLLPLLEARELEPRPVFAERTPPWEILLEQLHSSASARPAGPDYSCTLYHCPPPPPGVLPNPQNAFFSFRQGDSARWDSESRDISVRDGAWKLIRRDSRRFASRNSWWEFVSGQKREIAEYELYSLAQDPFELQNLWGKDHAAFARLKPLLDDFKSKRDAYQRWAPATSRPDALIPYP